MPPRPDPGFGRGCWYGVAWSVLFFWLPLGLLLWWLL